LLILVNRHQADGHGFLPLALSMAAGLNLSIKGGSDDYSARACCIRRSLSRHEGLLLIGWTPGIKNPRV
jgi:hypothetical protein